MSFFENIGKPTDRLAVLDVLNKERDKCLHPDEEKSFYQSVNNPLTAAAIRYARNAAYGINHGGNRVKDFQPEDDFKPRSNFELKPVFKPQSDFEMGM